MVRAAVRSQRAGRDAGVCSFAGRPPATVDTPLLAAGDLHGRLRSEFPKLDYAIRSAADVEAVVALGRRLPSVVCAAMGDSANPVAVARDASAAIEHMTRRLLELAVDRLGSPPVPWPWLALGSAARLEQSFLTDQDHALAFDPTGARFDDVDRYFLQVARSVSSGLEAAGIPRCHADVVAETRSLRRPIAHWEAAFSEWIKDPRLEAGRQASILFDLRRVAGPLDAERALEPIIGSASRRPRFLRRMAIQSLDVPPPAKRPRRFAVVRRAPEKAALDVKHHALTPIVNLARSYALEAGVSGAGTLARLAGAAERGRIDDETRIGLTEAFRLVWRVRLEHHVSCVEQGTTPDDFIDWRMLDSLTRLQLEGALRTVGRAQAALRGVHGLRA